MLKNPGIGGTEIRPDTSEAIASISPNRTLFTERLTTDPPLKPEVVTGLQHIGAVFEHYRPSVTVAFSGADGEVLKEQLVFRQLSDFGVAGITAQSKFLRELAQQRELYIQVIRQLGGNKMLKSALMDPEARQSLLLLIRRLLEGL